MKIYVCISHAHFFFFNNLSKSPLYVHTYIYKAIDCFFFTLMNLAHLLIFQGGRILGVSTCTYIHTYILHKTLFNIRSCTARITLFHRVYNHIKPASLVNPGCDYMLFKVSVKMKEVLFYC